MRIINLFIGLLTGLLIAWMLFGLRILPETIMTYTFIGEPIEMDAEVAAPVLIRLPSGAYYYIYQYEDNGDTWYLYDYVQYYDGHWGARIIGWPLTLGMNKSYEVIMMPRFYEVEGAQY